MLLNFICFPMKKLSFIILFTLIGFASVKAQTNTEVSFAKIDASPLDVVYYPLNVTKSKENVAPVMRVIYSRPQKKGREIFGVLEQYGKVWRLGANESTEIEFFKPVKIGGKKVKAGRYSAFVIPNAENWTFILNKQTDKWGAFSYNSQKDVLRVNIPTIKLTKDVDTFGITFTKSDNGANMVMAWDKTQSVLPIVF